MNHSPLYTENRTRLILKRAAKGSTTNWIFLPGGPGLGSEYYAPFISKLDLPANIWTMDFPGDGSNTLDVPIDYDKEWRESLLQAFKSLPNVVLFCHSFSSMFVLTVPEVEPLLTGLVIVGGLPVRNENIKPPKMTPATKAYFEHKTNQHFKEFTIEHWYHFFSTGVKEEGLKILESLPYQYHPYDWSHQSFHPQYEAQWVPEKLPTLIMGGELDRLTALKKFKADPKFDRGNIEIVEIKGGSHFPWMEAFYDVEGHLKEFSKHLS